MRNPRERAELVEQLRRRHLDGTLDEVLIPEDPPIDALLGDLFPELKGTRRETEE